MLKKTLVLLTVVVILVSCLVFPASASTFYWDYEDWIVGEPEIVTINDVDYYEMMVRLPPSALSMRLRYDGAQKKVVYGTNDGYPLELTYSSSTPKDLTIQVGVGVEDLFWGENIVGEVAITATVGSSLNNNEGSVQVFMTQTNYDIDGVSSGTAVVGSVSQEVFEGTHTVQGSIDGAFGTGLGMRLKDYGPISGNATFYLYDLYFTFWIPVEFRDEWNSNNLANVTAKQNMLLKNQEILIDDMTTEQEITNEKLDELPGQIGDEYQSIIDKENQAANDAGDSAAGELMEIIPNESQGFMNAIQSLVDSMSYSGTEAKLPIPPIKLPAIPGVMDEICLTDELSVDFGYWVQKLPSGVLQLVQILGTISLIVYCFKELYSTIAYAMTLKGGSNSE